MKGLKEIGSFFTSIHGIIVCVIAVIAVGSSVLLRHDARVISDYTKTYKSISGQSIDSIFRLRIAPVTDSLRIVSHNQRMLQNNYSNFVEANTNSFEEWKKYMNGLEFTVVQSTVKSVNKAVETAPEMKIRVQKIKK